MKDEDKLIHILENSSLFSKMDKKSIIKFLDSTDVQFVKYRKNDFIFKEGDTPRKIYLLLEGEVSIEKYTKCGRKILITDINRNGDMFGEVYLYIKKHQFDVFAECYKDCEILEINSDIFDMPYEKMNEVNIQIMKNLLSLFAQKAYMMNSKLKVLSSGDLREKIVRFLLYNNENDDKIIKLKMNREDLAHYLNTARPSLSRELSKMQKEGLIELDKKNIIIKDLRRLEEYL